MVSWSRLHGISPCNLYAVAQAIIHPAYDRLKRQRRFITFGSREMRKGIAVSITPIDNADSYRTRLRLTPRSVGSRSAIACLYASQEGRVSDDLGRFWRRPLLGSDRGRNKRQALMIAPENFEHVTGVGKYRDVLRSKPGRSFWVGIHPAVFQAFHIIPTTIHNPISSIR